MTDNERQDDPAMDGMLMEYHWLPTDVDEELVDSVMRGVHSMEARPRRLVKRFVWMGAAATVAFLAVTSVLLLLPSKPLGTVASKKATIQRDGKVVVLKKGGKLFANDVIKDKARLKLADDSVVKTDHATALTLNKPSKGQRVNMDLMSGRAFFKVSKAPGRFMVKTDALIEVKGTIFGVDYQPGKDETLVAVLEGTVAVSNAVGSIDVHRGQSSKAERSRAPVQTEANPYDSMIWARDPIQFDNHPIVDVFTWIEANSQFTFEYDRSEISGRRITIYITDEPISQVIDQVLVAGGLDSERSADVITVKPW